MASFIRLEFLSGTKKKRLSSFEFWQVSLLGFDRGSDPGRDSLVSEL